jgi:hypothetical protein
MSEWLEYKILLKEAVLAWFEVLSQHLPEGLRNVTQILFQY